MKKTLMVLVLSSLALIGCQKKGDDAPAGPPACSESHTFSPGIGRCVYNGHCSTGLVQSPTQPSMCADARTGMIVETQRCGTGFVLTTEGCGRPCPSNPTQGLIGSACMPGISGPAGYYNINQQNGGYNQQPAYQQYPNYYQGYGANTGWFRPW